MTPEAAVQETTKRSLAGTITFPEVVRILLEAGIESYTVDLSQNLKTFYPASGKPFSETFEYKGPAIAPEFAADQVIGAIRASQAGKITYPVFLEQIMNAGCYCYTAYLAGRKVIYSGRKGDSHTEHFPAGK